MNPEEIQGSKAIDKTSDGSTAEAETEEAPYPPLLEYLQSKEGHELASRIVAILEDVKKATIESATETHKRDSEFQHRIQKLWLCIQSGVFALTILIAAVLAWHGKLDSTVSVLMGTLFGYFLGRPMR